MARTIRLQRGIRAKKARLHRGCMFPNSPFASVEEAAHISGGDISYSHFGKIRRKPPLLIRALS